MPRTVDSRSAEESGAREARRMLRPLRVSLRRLLRLLVETPSVNMPPDGAETAAQQLLHTFLREHGIRSEIYDIGFLEATNDPLVRSGRNYRGRSNVCVHRQGTGCGKSLLLSGHMDTVPEGLLPWSRSPWSRSPWSGTVRDGRLHGLGSFDMKGGLVAQAAVITALERAGVRLAGDLLFESVADEEYGGGGGTVAARRHSGTADACIIAEGTQLEVYRATRGGFTVDLSVSAGDAAGYFATGAVISPAVPMGRLLGWVESVALRRTRVKATGAYRDFVDPVPVQVLAAQAGSFAREAPLSVPLHAAVRVYFQFLPGEEAPKILAEIKRNLEEFCRSDAFFSRYPVQWTPTLGAPLRGHELSADHALTRCVAACASAAMQRPAVVTAAPYPCDAGLMQRDFGIPTLIFGPSGAGAHNPDEWVDIESVFTTAEVLLATALAWCA